MIRLRTALLAAAYVAFAIAVLGARPQEAPGPLARDFEAYWSAGAAFDRHADPYAAGIWNDERGVPGVDARREGPLPFVNPPATLPLWSLMARMPYSVAAAWWLLVLCGALGGLLLASLWGARARIGPRNALASVALAISFGPITSDLALGQFALVAAFGASLVVASRRILPAAIGGVLSFAQPNVMPTLLSQLSRRAAIRAMLFAAVVTYFLGVLTAGWHWLGAYAALLAAHAGAERFSAIQMTPAAIAYGFGASPALAMAVGVVAAAAAVVFAIRAARRVRDAFARFGVFAALLPFVSGFLHEHDLVMAFPAVVWCAVRAAPRARAIALVGTLLVAVDWLGLAQRPGGAAQSALLAVAAWCAFTALRPLPITTAIGMATAAVATAFAGAVMLAVVHPAPVWPAAMHAAALTGNGSVAQLWAAQQEATGLNRPVAAWAFLRALSLTGCALLAFAICSRSAYYRTA